MGKGSCCGTQSPWLEKRKAVTGNHGLKTLATSADHGGAGNTAFNLVSGGVPNQPTEILPQEVC